MKEDLRVLINSPNRSDYELGISIFIDKWKDKKDFVAYIKSTWFDQNENWYLGFSKMPATNNALEGFNGSLKTNYTFRERLPVGPLIETLKKVIYDNSNSYNGQKTIHQLAEITVNIQKAAFEFIKENRPIAKVTDPETNFTVVRVAGSIFKTMNEVSFGYKSTNFLTNNANRQSHTNFELFKNLIEIPDLSYHAS